MEDKDISIIVNSMGATCPGFGYEHSNITEKTLAQPWLDMVEKGEFTYENIGEKQALDVTIINTIPQLMFTKWALTKFETRKNHSALIDLSSSESSAYCASRGVYGASKAFSNYLTRGLAISKSKDFLTNVDFMTVTPGPILTKMNPVKKMLISSVDDCVDGCMRNLGKSISVYGSRKHEVFFFFMECVTSVVPAKWLEL